MILLIATILGVIGLDQLTKWLAVTQLQGKPSFPLWKDVLHFTYVENRGAAFGMLSEHRWVFMIISTVAILGLLVYLLRFAPKSRIVRYSLAMIIGGGIGNMIDRILLGYVIDFIDFTLIDFAVFNVADSFVTVGAFLLMGYMIWDTVKESKKPKEAEEKKPETEQSNAVSQEASQEAPDGDADKTEDA